MAFWPKHTHDGGNPLSHRLFALMLAIALCISCLAPPGLAEEDTDVLLTDALAFRRLSMTNIYVRCFAYELASKRLSDMLWKMQQVLFLSADRRFAIFLHDFQYMEQSYHEIIF